MRRIFTLVLAVILVNTALAQEVKVVNGRHITNDPIAKGIASYYHDKFVGRQTSTGEIFSNDKFTAASNTLKLNTYVKVTNLKNGKYIYVRINDRMHKDNKRLIDMASICAKKLGYHYDGLAKVKVEIVPKDEGRKGVLAQRQKLQQNTQKEENQL